MRNVARLGYDGVYLYAAFEFDDPAPAAIRSPLGDRDNVNSSTDYGGVILDSRNDAKTAQMFLANAAGIQYDALTNDAALLEVRVRRLLDMEEPPRVRRRSFVMPLALLFMIVGAFIVGALLSAPYVALLAGT